MVDDDLPDNLTSADVARYADLTRAARRSRLETISPPPDIWRGIVDELGLDVTGLVEPDPEPELSPVVPLRPRPADAAVLRRRLWPFVASAAAAVAVIAGVVAVAGGDDPDRELASAALLNDGLDPVGSGLSAEATLVDHDGELAVHLELPSLPDVEGYYEVWVIDTDVVGMYSLGAFHGNGDYPLPTGVDPAGFPVVDVSIEPTDGQPTHSGTSILRGVLDL